MECQCEECCNGGTCIGVKTKELNSKIEKLQTFCADMNCGCMGYPIWNEKKKEWE